MKQPTHIAQSIAQSLQPSPERELTELIARESQRLFAFIRSRVPELEDAEDILQDVFAQLSSTGLDSIEQASSWMFTVARNKITDSYRKKKPERLSQQRVSQRSRPEQPPLNLADILPDLSNNPEQMYLRNVILEELEEALAELPQAQREVFELHEFEDLSFKEISAKVGVSVNTLLSRKRYAVLHLRNRLQQLYQELIEL